MKRCRDNEVGSKKKRNRTDTGKGEVRHGGSELCTQCTEQKTEKKRATGKCEKKETDNGIEKTKEEMRRKQNQQQKVKEMHDNTCQRKTQTEQCGTT